MAVAGILILIIVAVLVVLARKEEVPAECNASKVTEPFFRIAVYLVRFVQKGEILGRRIDHLREKIFVKNEERFRLLEPAADVHRKTYLHVVSKLGLCFLFLSVGTAFALLIGYRESQESFLGEDGTLLRKAYGKGRYSVTLNAQIEEESFEDVKIDVYERKYTKEEIEEMLPDFHAALEKTFLKENDTADHVTSSTDPVSEVNGYPFYVEWSFSDRSVMRQDGRLKEKLPEEGVLVIAEAKISYEDFSEIYSFPVMVYPQKLSDREEVYAALRKTIEESDTASETSEVFRLPVNVNGFSVSWSEEKQDHTLLLLALVIVMVGVIWWGRDRDLDKRLAQKDMQMLEDYPEIASKLSLYVGAGMTLRLAWKKIAEDGKGKGRVAYEEMLLAVYEMESGIGELSAYQHFAKRSRVQRYVKMISLIEQSVKLGARGFLDALRRESEDALEEKKNTIKRKGEEAGTKLLVPMILMLAIVMIVIIVPAFMGI